MPLSFNLFASYLITISTSKYLISITLFILPLSFKDFISICCIVLPTFFIFFIFVRFMVSLTIGLSTKFAPCYKFTFTYGEKLRSCWEELLTFGALFLRGIVHGLNHLCLVTLFL